MDLICIGDTFYSITTILNNHIEPCESNLHKIKDFDPSEPKNYLMDKKKIDGDTMLVYV